MVRILPVWKAKLQVRLVRLKMAELDDPGHPHAMILNREALGQLREAREARADRGAKGRNTVPSEPAVTART